MQGQTIAERYQYLADNERKLYMDRAQDVSKLTLPTVFPEDFFSKSSRINTPYQSLGARAVNNLASKLLLALLPPNTPFFKFALTDIDKQNIDDEFENMSTEIASAFSALEQQIVAEIESSNLRTAMYQAFIQLIISGNALLYIGDMKDVRVHKLTNYVVQRDAKGTILCIIIRETVAKEAMPPEYLAYLSEGELSGVPSAVDVQGNQVDIYTKIQRVSETKFISVKEINKVPVEGSDKTYKVGELPYLALRFSRVDGENYGRGYAEEYLGDLVSLEGLTKAIVEASAIASKTLFLVNPAGTTNVGQLSRAENGDFIKGNPEDVSAMRVDKSNDFRFAFETAGAIQQRLTAVFLLTSSIQRDAERVTAEEIRLMARELEEALGGIYTVLSQELQLPLINVITGILKKKKKMPDLPEDLVNITISTGLEALGRGHDLQKLNAFLANISQMGEQAFGLVNLPSYIERVALSLGLNIQGLIKTPEQIQAEQQQAMENSPEVINQVGSIIKEDVANERAAEQTNQ